MLSYLFNAAGQDPWLPITGLFIFISLYIGTIIWTFKRNKHYLTKMSALPLESSNQNGATTHD
jgi:hypothetical protein